MYTINSNNTFKYFILFFMIFTLFGCNQKPPESRIDTNIKQVACVPVASDNSHSYSLGSCVEIDTNTYIIKVKVSEVVNHSQTLSQSHASGYNGYVSYSSRTWQEGKGIVPVVLLESSPDVTWVEEFSLMIIKTTDLKVMGLPNNSITWLVCNHDIEVLSPIYNGQPLTTDRLTNEFDVCRMLDGTYIPGE